MKHLRIRRLETSQQGTIGVLLVDRKCFCWTLEPPELLNAQNKSCIPVGQYRAIRTVSHRFGDTFKVEDVPERTDILFHAGNTVKDTTGCILVGEIIRTVVTSRSVLNSSKTLIYFMDELHGKSVAHLTITAEY